MAAFDYCVYLWLEMVFLPLMGQNAQFQDEREASES